MRSGSRTPHCRSIRSRSSSPKLAEHGRVLVLLDACHSGATTLDGSAQVVDAAELRHELAAANITVLTSSGGREDSLEDDAWQHGAFTRALLDALNDPAADADRIGLINPNALAHYVARHVASLTDGKQTPDMEVRFDTTVFAVGLQLPKLARSGGILDTRLGKRSPGTPREDPSVHTAPSQAPPIETPVTLLPKPESGIFGDAHGHRKPGSVEEQ